MKQKSQARILKNFSAGAKRMETAVELSEMVKELALAGFKRQYPQANKGELLKLWAKEISLPY